MLGAAETASAALECGGEAAIVAETDQPGAGSSIYRLERRCQRFHHLLGEAAQRLNPAGTVGVITESCGSGAAMKKAAYPSA